MKGPLYAPRYLKSFMDYLLWFLTTENIILLVSSSLENNLDTALLVTTESEPRYGVFHLTLHSIALTSCYHTYTYLQLFILVLCTMLCVKRVCASAQVCVCLFYLFSPPLQQF